MAVAQLYYHLAPSADVSIVARALIRLLRSHREVQIVALNTIASMSVNRKVSCLVSFCVHTDDEVVDLKIDLCFLYFCRICLNLS